jgi:CHAT domain-containing protein
MVSFHEHLLNGEAKDEALRLAMEQVASDPKTSHPYFWAAFFMTGDLDNPRR